MRTTIAVAASLAAALALTACSTSNSHSDKPARMNAAADYAVIHGAIPTTALTATVTAANDGNHLLGRPHQYTSGIKFADSRIKGSDVDGLDKDDVTRGGGIEVFANHDDAQTRADYIQSIGKASPLFSEYDYVFGDAVVRVSRLLTPDKAGEYKTAAAKLD